MDVYADQIHTTGRHHTHEVGKKTDLKAGEKITHLTKVHQTNGSKKVSMSGPSGQIIIDSGGITLKGNVKIKGTLAITSGSPDQVESLKINFNKGKAICVPCLLQETGS